MDEENENSSLKKKIKKKIKRTIRRIMTFVLPIFLFIMLVVLMWYVIEELISIEVSKGTAGELADSTSISEDGSITIEDTVYEDIRNILRDKGIEPEDFYLGDKDFVEGTDTTYLEKMISAEIVSSYPDTGVGDIRGIVKVQRNNKEIKYKNKADFEAMAAGVASSEDVGDINDYYTLDDDMNIEVLTMSSSTTEFPDGSKETMANNTLAKLNYKKLIAPYSMPFEFLFALMQTTENPEYVSKVADLVLEESEIVVNIYDSETTSITIQDVTWDEVFYRGEKRDKTKYNYNVPLPLKFVSRTRGGPETTKITTYSLSVKLKVTDVKTWIYNKTAIYEPITTSSSYENETEPEEKVTGETNTRAYKAEDEYVVEKTRIDIENKKTKIISNATMTNWRETGDSNEEINTDRFLGLWKNDKGEYEQGALYNADGLLVKYEVPKENTKRSPAKYITKYPELLFEFLSNSEDTQGIERIMRYVLYVYTGKDYGVTDIEELLKLFDLKDINMGGNALLKQYIRFWEHSWEPPKSEDGKNYIIETDPVGNVAVGYGIDIFNGGFYDRFVAAGYPTEVGGEVPIEFVDALENETMEDARNYIESAVSGLDLTGYQIDALVSRAYNCGLAGAIDIRRGTPSMDFVESYNKYWDQEKDDLFEEKDTNANFKHKLYEQYMSKPVTANGEYLAGLEKRRKSEWVLFQTGYFDILDKWYSGGGDFIWPAPGYPAITSPYGPRNTGIPGASKFHLGIDIGIAYGKDIVASKGGEVVAAGWYGGTGLTVKIDHGNGEKTLYGHGSGISVSEGDIVQAGDVIMQCGSTGISSGPHLHFALEIEGAYIDPLQYVEQPSN